VSGSKRGERRGGRQKGTPNKITAKREAEIAASGLLPGRENPEAEPPRRAALPKKRPCVVAKGPGAALAARRPTRSEAFHHLAPASSHLIQSHPANVILTSTRRTTSGALRTGLSVRQRWGPSLFPAPDDADPVGALIHVLVLPQEAGRNTQTAASSLGVARTPTKSLSSSGAKNDVRAPATVFTRPSCL
jgi:hypothetical protein